MPTRKATPTKKRTAPARKTSQRYWSREVTEHSDAMDLEDKVFTRSPRAIALSLKRSAERSSRRKSAPYRSAMSMLTFYENRAGHNLPASRRRVLEEAKDELRKLFHREPKPKAPGRARTSSKQARS
ncbi:Protein of unknown function [Stigmatella aurantiaca]|uniref:DUF3175 domain-containing protein n=1 Tax=Stigmatella aurantiaca TaxID=41 RepID=A0A1H7GIP6_STIAU|nr:DUF3175 domain-containing protein [Stigmatella aurantiaca]SEK37961.1 Protein of unknown function [Stigmatella aurantiaca]